MGQSISTLDLWYLLCWKYTVPRTLCEGEGLLQVWHVKTFLNILPLLPSDLSKAIFLGQSHPLLATTPIPQLCQMLLSLCLTTLLSRCFQGRCLLLMHENHFLTWNRLSIAYYEVLSPILSCIMFLSSHYSLVLKRYFVPFISFDSVSTVGTIIFLKI